MTGYQANQRCQRERCFARDVRTYSRVGQRIAATTPLCGVWVGIEGEPMTRVTVDDGHTLALAAVRTRTTAIHSTQYRSPPSSAGPSGQAMQATGERVLCDRANRLLGWANM